MNDLFVKFTFTRIQESGLIATATVKYLSSVQLNNLSNSNFGNIFELGWSSKPSDFFGVGVITGLNNQNIQKIFQMLSTKANGKVIGFTSGVMVGWINALSSDQVALLSAAQIERTKGSVNQLEKRVINSLNGAILGAMSKEWLEQLTSEQIASISDVMKSSSNPLIKSSAFQSVNLNYLSTEQLQFVTEGQARGLTISQWTGLGEYKQMVVSLNSIQFLSAGIWNTLPRATINEVSIKNLDVATIGAFEENLLKLLSPEQIWSMSENQLRQLGGKNLALSSLKIAGLTKAQYHALTGNGSHPLTYKCMALKSAEDLRAMLVVDIVRIPSAAIADMSHASLSNLTKAQSISITGEQVDALTSSQINALPKTPDYLADDIQYEQNRTDLQLQDTPNENLQQISRQRLRGAPVAQVKALTGR